MVYVPLQPYGTSLRAQGLTFPTTRGGHAVFTGSWPLLMALKALNVTLALGTFSAGSHSSWSAPLFLYLTRYKIVSLPSCLTLFCFRIFKNFLVGSGSKTGMRTTGLPLFLSEICFFQWKHISSVGILEILGVSFQILL